jgi:type IV secretory pathway VirB10-like protein
MNSLTRILSIALVIETVLLIWLLFNSNSKSQDNKQLTENILTVTNEKDAVKAELQNMLDQYESLKSNNKGLNEKLEQEQEKIKVLLTQLSTIKRSDIAKIKELERETETLRSIMKSYIKQIDSLNTRNKILVSENKEITHKYESEKQEKDELITLKDSLTVKVKQASILEASGVSLLALTAKGNETSRTKRLAKFKTCFTIEDNMVTKQGTKTVYIRIAGPDNMILRNKESGFFMFEGKEIAYSSKREFEYNGKDVEICMYWINDIEQPEGDFSMDIFVDGYNIGTKNISLK